MSKFIISLIITIILKHFTRHADTLKLDDARWPTTRHNTRHVQRSNGGRKGTYYHCACKPGLRSEPLLNRWPWLSH